MKLLWTSRAKRAFALALDYLDERNPAASRKVEMKLLAAVDRIRDFPAAHRSGRVAGTRELVVPGTPYIVVYRIEKQGVTILHVLHSKQRWPDH